MYNRNPSSSATTCEASGGKLASLAGICKCTCTFIRCIDLVCSTHMHKMSKHFRSRNSKNCNYEGHQGGRHLAAGHNYKYRMMIVQGAFIM